jgi:Na+-translocating ferredoxin:NAD+ oxidoreductase subunit C
MVRGISVFNKRKFQGGIFIGREKGNAGTFPIERLTAPSFVTIPLTQYGGASAQTLVKVGDHVAVGQMIGAGPDDSAAPVHASVSGVVTKLFRHPCEHDPNVFSITIENNGKEEFASPIPYDKPWTESAPEELIKKIRLSGIVDWNGRGVSLHSKLAEAHAGHVDTLIINTLESEPDVSSGTRLCIERIGKVATGIAICKKITGVSKCLIVVDGQNVELLRAAESVCSDERLAGTTLVKIKSIKYPLHEERLLVRSCTGIELPSEASTIDAGCVVISAVTAASVNDAIVELIPSFERVVTVAGPAAVSPKNLQVRIGTPIRLLLEMCGVDFVKMIKCVAGGPLSGSAVQDLDTPITKATKALLALEKTFPAEQLQPCIGCRRCSAVCPMRLDPSRLARYAKWGNVVELNEWHVGTCIECGCCAFVCPSKINLQHYIMFGKLLARRSDTVSPTTFSGQKAVQ